jgi:hypothetical protein
MGSPAVEMCCGFHHVRSPKLTAMTEHRTRALEVIRARTGSPAETPAEAAARRRPTLMTRSGQSPVFVATLPLRSVFGGTAPD